MLMSRSGSIDCRHSSCAITAFAISSVIGVPRKMIRSSNSFVYGSIRRMPYDVRSSHCGMK